MILILFFLHQVQNTYCGPEQESCVGNQTLKDESCLVACTGLYADIADDSHHQLNRQNTAALEQNMKNMMKGII